MFVKNRQSGYTIKTGVIQAPFKTGQKETASKLCTIQNGGRDNKDIIMEICCFIYTPFSKARRLTFTHFPSCKIWGSHSSEYVNVGLLFCNAVWICRYQHFGETCCLHPEDQYQHFLFMTHEKFCRSNFLRCLTALTWILLALMIPLSYFVY
jgi:hypothetical protein